MFYKGTLFICFSVSVRLVSLVRNTGVTVYTVFTAMESDEYLLRKAGGKNPPRCKD